MHVTCYRLYCTCLHNRDTTILQHFFLSFFLNSLIIYCNRPNKAMIHIVVSLLHNITHMLHMYIPYRRKFLRNEICTKSLKTGFSHLIFHELGRSSQLKYTGKQHIRIHDYVFTSGYFLTKLAKISSFENLRLHSTYVHSNMIMSV